MLTHLYSPGKRESGFTLIELLVVIIIIGILAALAIPLFLDNRKAAVDASVKSDVRNTATQVQSWLAANPDQIATDVDDYQSKGGNVAKSSGNTVKLSVATDGSYLVCGYATNAGKSYTATSAAYVFDSTTGRFGLGDCASGIVGSGNPNSAVAPTFTSANITATPAGRTLPNYSYQIPVDANPTATFTLKSGTLPAGLQLGANGKITGTATTNGTSSFVVQADNALGSATTTVSLTVQSVLSMTTADPVPGAVNQQYSVSINASGTPAVTSMRAEGLPAGLSATFSGTRILISGVPTEIKTTQFTVYASNGVEISRQYSLVVKGTSAAGFNYTFDDKSAAGWTGTNVSASSGALCFSGTQNNGVAVYASFVPLGDVYLEAGHSYTLSATPVTVSGSYTTSFSASIGQGSIGGAYNLGSYYNGTYTNFSKTWTQTATTQAYELDLNVSGFTGAGMGACFDNIKLVKNN